MSLDDSLSTEEQSMLQEALQFARVEEEAPKELDQRQKVEALEKHSLDVLTHIWHDRIKYVGFLESGAFILSVYAFRMVFLL